MPLPWVSWSYNVPRPEGLVFRPQEDKELSGKWGHVLPFSRCNLEEEGPI